MSSDLLNEFGGFGENPAGLSKGQVIEKPIDIEDDEFGDFEVAEKKEEGNTLSGRTTGPSVQSTKQAVQYGTPTSERNHDIVAQGRRPVQVGDWKQTIGSAHGRPKASQSGPAILSSGHLQTETISRQGVRHSTLDNDDEWGNFVDQSVFFDADRFGTSQQTSGAVVQAGSDAFDDFEEWEPQDTSHVPFNLAQPGVASTQPGQVDPAPMVYTMRSATQEPPPTNVPPPSMLLSIITAFYQSLRGELKAIITQDRASSDPYEALDQKRIDDLQQRASIIRSSARVIAGRKFRWMRDTFLSQSMKIGPASKEGAIKLNSVNKSEGRREDHEVAEALTVWKQQLGSLRSIIALVNVHLSDRGIAIPEISANMPIRAAKPSEGAITAPKCCFLCGIKRDERVLHTDTNVEDSFGEWWTEHWGHVDCVVFWNELKSSLHQR